MRWRLAKRVTKLFVAGTYFVRRCAAWWSCTSLLWWVWCVLSSRWQADGVFYCRAGFFAQVDRVLVHCEDKSLLWLVSSIFKWQRSNYDGRGHSRPQILKPIWTGHFIPWGTLTSLKGSKDRPKYCQCSFGQHVMEEPRRLYCDSKILVRIGYTRAKICSEPESWIMQLECPMLNIDSRTKAKGWNTVDDVCPNLFSIPT